MGFFQLAVNQLVNYMNIIIKDIYDIIHICAYLLIIIVAVLYAYYKFDKHDYRRNIYQPVQKKLLIAIKLIRKQRLFVILNLILKTFYKQHLSIYIASSRIPYYYKILNPQLLSIKTKVKTLTKIIKWFFKKKN